MATVTSENRLRQIAILVASVDSASARHILMNLPIEIARKVRSLAAEIGPIPPNERQKLATELQKFQNKNSVESNRFSGTEAGLFESTAPRSKDSSTINQLMADWPQENSTVQESQTSNSTVRTLPSDTVTPGTTSNSNTPHAPAWTRLSVDALLRFVRHERPTVIAVIVSQLSALQAATVLQRLPRSLSRDVLQCIGSLQEIDSEARQTIDDHLSQRLSEYRQKIETEYENVRRINDLLAAAPADLRQQWAIWLRPDSLTSNEFAVAGSGASSPTANPHSPQRVSHSAESRTSTRPVNSDNAAGEANLNSKLQGDDSTSDESPSTIPMAQPGQARSVPNRSNSSRMNSLGSNARSSTIIDLEVVLTLSPENLARLLSGLDSQTILLALAGASPQFMSRFSAMLESSDAKKLNDRIRRIGSLQLRDVDEAQRRIIDAYWAMVGPMGLRLSA